MFRKTKQYERQCAELARMREAKERKRLDGVAPDYPIDLPDCRIRITVEILDRGGDVHEFELYTSKMYLLMANFGNFAD